MFVVYDQYFLVLMERRGDNHLILLLLSLFFLLFYSSLCFLSSLLLYLLYNLTHVYPLIISLVFFCPPLLALFLDVIILCLCFSVFVFLTTG